MSFSFLTFGLKNITLHSKVSTFINSKDKNFRMKIYINDLTSKVKELKQIKNQAKSILSYLKLPSSTEVSISFIDDSYMRELNLKYRDNNRTTDVLSFPQEGELLGDILISVDKATAQSEELGHTFEQEARRLVVHGLLHLLGYDHKKLQEAQLMEEKEKEVLEFL